jgi:hypothetical protein
MHVPAAAGGGGGPGMLTRSSVGGVGSASNPTVRSLLSRR